MTTRRYKDQDQAIAVLKRALWLAWKTAGNPFGMGILQDNPSANEEEVWNNAINMGDYPTDFSGGSLNADYVFGRMIKISMEFPEGGKLEVPDTKTNPEYEVWCTKYPTYDSLFDAAQTEIIPPE